MTKEMQRIKKGSVTYLKLVNSIAPDIYGFNVLKESILLQLFGAGINILLFGDPGVAKSRILDSVSEITLNKKIKCFDRFDLMESAKKEEIIKKMRSEKISVLATANPKLGRFDPYTPIPEQTDLSPYLLSAFDLIFIIRDLPSKAQDEAVASYVLEGQVKSKRPIELNLIKEYISFAKQKPKPKLTKGAIKEIKDFYIRIRNPPMKKRSEIRAVPITVRQLQTILKLAEAQARARLSEKIEIKDAEKVLEILKLSLCQVGCIDE